MNAKEAYGISLKGTLKRIKDIAKLGCTRTTLELSDHMMDELIALGYKCKRQIGRYHHGWFGDKETTYESILVDISW